MSFWKDKRVMVTGATGLLGSWLVDELLAREAHVTCLVRDWVPDSRLLSEGADRHANLVRGSLEATSDAPRFGIDDSVLIICRARVGESPGASARGCLAAYKIMERIIEI